MVSKRQRGAVSIFAVVFSALLLTILTVGFIRLMISGQQRAINNDLSQSAYDAALAGVEDAKRLVRSCLTDTAAACEALDAPDDCRVIARAGITGDRDASETVIQSSSGGDGAQFDQAYTCVNIAMDTPDVRTQLIEGEVGIIPLQATDSFDTIVVEWFVQGDAPDGTVAATAPTPVNNQLPQVAAWGQATPPLMRAQLINPGGNFTTAELDGSDASRTVFLRPMSMTPEATGSNGTVVVPLGDYSRATDGQARSNTPRTLTCSSGFQNNGHSCLARLQIGSMISPAESASALLRLNTVYNSATVRVTLYNGSDLVYFDDVQPTVDSTGRANNLFRRVEARLAIGEDVPLPSRVVDVVNSLCKDFSVGSSGATAGTCTP